MTTVAIWSKALDAKVIVEIVDGQPEDAWFYDCGELLSHNEWISLTNSVYDMQQAQDEVERCNG